MSLANWDSTLSQRLSSQLILQNYLPPPARALPSLTVKPISAQPCPVSPAPSVSALPSPWAPHYCPHSRQNAPPLPGLTRNPDTGKAPASVHRRLSTLAPPLFSNCPHAPFPPGPRAPPAAPTSKELPLSLGLSPTRWRSCCPHPRVPSAPPCPLPRAPVPSLPAPRHRPRPRVPLPPPAVSGRPRPELGDAPTPPPPPFPSPHHLLTINLSAFSCSTASAGSIIARATGSALRRGRPFRARPQPTQRPDPASSSFPRPLLPPGTGGGRGGGRAEGAEADSRLGACALRLLTGLVVLEARAARGENTRRTATPAGRCVELRRCASRISSTREPGGEVG